MGKDPAEDAADAGSVAAPHTVPANREKRTAVGATFLERAPATILAWAKVLALVIGVWAVIQLAPQLQSILPRISRVKALGIEVDLAKLTETLSAQIASASATDAEGKPNAASIDVAAVNGAISRARMSRWALSGAMILWIDDQPANNVHFRRLLRQLGATVETASSTAEAKALGRVEEFDLVLSDIRRGGVEDIGARDLPELREAGIDAPAVFYVSRVTADPKPAGAFAITARAEELLHFVIDGLERSRAERVEQDAESRGRPEESPAPIDAGTGE